MEDGLSTAGFLQVAESFGACEDAWDAARAIVDHACSESLAIIGDFVVPPLQGPPSRDFQTLHFDFGLPLLPVAPVDVALFTALYIAPDIPPGDAVTRLVPIRALAERHSWTDRDELVRRFADYGHSHGAWEDDAGYVEGSLARIVEAALGQKPVLPSVKTNPEFLCGTEFTSLAGETAFFAERDLALQPVQIEIRLQPGELLVFDNLALAHGRRGTRQPGELNQRIFGHTALPAEEQLKLRNRFLDVFATATAANEHS